MQYTRVYETKRYHSLLEDGLLKVIEGVTTTEEVLRVATIRIGEIDEHVE